MLCDAARSGVTAVAPARCCLQSDGDTATAYCRVVGFACCYGCFKKMFLVDTAGAVDSEQAADNGREGRGDADG